MRTIKFSPMIRILLIAITAMPLLTACGLKIESAGRIDREGTPTASTEVACDSTGAPYGGGTGAADAPYAICTPTQFMAIGSNLSAFYILASNLDFTAVTYVPIGSTATPFLGSIDGNGKKISNVTYANAADTENVALIRESGTGATIFDLSLENISMTGKEVTASLIGKATGTKLSNLQLKSITVVTKGIGGGVVGYFVANADTADEDVADLVIDTVSVNSSADGSTVGSSFDTGVGSFSGRFGGSGMITRATISSATIYWNPAGTNINGWTHVGGVVGYTAGLQLFSSTFQGTVEGGTCAVGGIIGQYDGNGVGSGYVEGVHLRNTTVTGKGYVGGFAGNWNRKLRTGNLSTLANSSFQGSLNGVSTSVVGGISGVIQGAFHEHISVKATINGVSNMGGLYGRATWTTSVDDVSFVGSITSSGGDNIGLIMGYDVNWAPVFNRVVVSGSITNPNGASVSTHYDYGQTVAGTFNNIFYRSSQVSGWTALSATPLTDPQMISSSNFTGFDFTNIWAMPTANPWAGILMPVLRIQCGKDGIVCP